MSYKVETRLAPKSVWYTPAEAKAYYGKYSRDGITIHWWGGNETADKHDTIVNLFLTYKVNGPVDARGSVNYVLSDNKITKMVESDNVAWTSQSGNPTTISIEHQPTLGAEGYKKSGWLVWQLEQKYKKKLKLYPHNYWYATSCPGTISLTKIRSEADKWARGGYNNSEGDDVNKFTPAQINQLTSIAFNRQATPQEKAAWSQVDASKLLSQVYKSTENKNLRTKASNYNKLKAASGDYTPSGVVSYIKNKLGVK